MNKRIRASLHRFVLLISTLWFACPLDARALNRQAILIETGGSAHVPAAQVSRVAVGDSQIVQVSATGADGVLFFGKSRGVTHVDIWFKSGKHQAYVVTVNPRGFESSYLIIKNLLRDVPSVTVAKSGDKIVLEGENVSDQDKRRVAQITAQYPDILDLTQTLGWDRMILLDVLVLELPTSSVRELGLKWGAAPGTGLSAAFDWHSNARASAAEDPSGSLSMSSPSSLLGLSASLSSRIDALSRNGEAVILAQPQLLTRSGSAAHFLAGGEVPYSTTDKDGRVNTIFKKYGVGLSITPQANSADTIRSSIEIEVSSVDPSLILPNGPAMRVRRASTEFNVRSGQTLILGGFISRENASDWDGLPGLEDVPILRGLFGTERSTARQTELAILVTPHIVDPDTKAFDERIAVARRSLDQGFAAAKPLKGLAGQHHFDSSEIFSHSENLTDQWED